MQAELDREHAELFLKTHNVGRLGCYYNGRSYVVPVTYVYDHNQIYSHTNAGMKLNMLRQNPQVCFEVDDITSCRQWQSVICWGRFEELEGQDMSRALDLMISRLIAAAGQHINQCLDSPIESVAHDIRLKSLKGATFRIHLNEISGRYERP